jgi:response regulator RpfG family c-di-GMP phosphodiesterase
VPDEGIHLEGKQGEGLSMSDTPPEAQDRDRSQWQGHRLAATVTRVLVFLLPLSMAALAGLLVSRSIPGTGAAETVVRFVITAIVSISVLILVERLARRFLPLAALLRLNLVFPDRAPSRFSVALRSTSVRKLQQWVREAQESEDVAALAEKVVTLASALNTHDRRTRGHCERTRALADLIVEELHLSPTEANEVRWGAFLHDIGKLVVPAEILNKPGKPTSREWEILKSHPEAGARLVEPLRHFLSSGVDAVGSHHENFDGSGYPSGLSGEDLPLAARIVSVADSFEVMTAVRAYKRPMSLQAARAELARRSGTQFDPHVVRAFLNVSLGRVHWTLGIAAWVAELPFLTILPRVAAQVSATAGTGSAITPIALPSIAAASLGAMAVIAPVRTPTSHTPVHAAAPPASAAPTTTAVPRSTDPSSSSPSIISTSTTAPAPSTTSAVSTASTGVTGSAPGVVGSALADPLGDALGNALGDSPPSVSVGTTVPAVAHALGADTATPTTTKTIESTVQAVADLLGVPQSVGDPSSDDHGSTTSTTLP